MSVCAGWSIVKGDELSGEARPLYCRSWSCKDCRPRRQRQLVAAALAGRPTTFITLTVNPAFYDSPSHRAIELAHAWRRVRRRALESGLVDSLEFLAVFEKTKRGEPHLHIVARCGYIPQAWLSAQMKAEIGAPIVDIRAVTSHVKVARYVSKYISKDPTRFGECKRYWSSRHYELPPEGEAAYVKPSKGEWSVRQQSTGEIFRMWKLNGYYVEERDDGVVRHWGYAGHALRALEDELWEWRGDGNAEAAARSGSGRLEYE